MKHIKKFNENVETNFTIEEIDRIVDESSKIGFTALPFYKNDKVLDKSKVTDTIVFEHIKTGNTITVHKWEITNEKFNIMTDNICDIFFTILFNEMDNQSYIHNYDGSY